MLQSLSFHVPSQDLCRFRNLCRVLESPLSTPLPLSTLRRGRALNFSVWIGRACRAACCRRGSLMNDPQDYTYFRILRLGSGYPRKAGGLASRDSQLRSCAVCSTYPFHHTKVVFCRAGVKLQYKLARPCKSVNLFVDQLLLFVFIYWQIP